MKQNPYIIESKIPQQGNKQDNTNEYYNIRIYKPILPLVNTITPIRFNETRTSPILNNPSLYQMAVIRFSIPANIPIFEWTEVGSYLKVGMTYGATTIIKTLTFVDYCGAPFCVPGQSILFYGQFTDIITTGLQEAFVDLKAAEPMAPPTEAPFFSYDAKTELCSLYGQQSYDVNSVVPTIKIYFSNFMHVKYFVSLKTVEVTTLTVPNEYYAQIRIQNNGNNIPLYPANYYQIEQEYRTLSLWNDLQTLLFETDTIPVEPEFEPSANDTTRRILTDFEPIVDINNRESFQFYPQGPLRWYDLKSEYPLRTIDLKALWQSKNGTTYPLYLNSGDVATLKLRFRKKGSETSYYEDSFET